MKGKDFPEEEKRYENLIKAIRGIKISLSLEEKRRIKEKLFSSLYPERFFFSKRLLLSIALIFLLLLPALAFLPLNQEKVKNKPFGFSLKESASREKIVKNPLIFKALPQFEVKKVAEVNGKRRKEESSLKKEERKGSLAQASKGDSAKEKEENLPQNSPDNSEGKNENQTGGGSSNNNLNNNTGGEGSPSPAPPPSQKVRTPPPPTNLTVLSGNLENILSWEGKGGVIYKIYKSSSFDGPYKLIGETKETNFREKINLDEVGYYFYKVSATRGRSTLESNSTPPVLNEKVYIKASLSADKESYILSSNGELSLHFPQGAVSEEVTITIEENGIPHDTPNYTDTFLTSSYDFQPEGLSFATKPLLSLRYISPVNEEQFEKDWLSKTAKIYYYDKGVKVWLDVSDNLSVDTENNRIASYLSHFSDYAGGYTVMPHGRYSANTNLCEVCHKAHDAQGNPLARRENVDLCYYCHGAPTSTLPASGAHGKNVQAEFIDSNDQSFSGEPTTQTAPQTFSQSTESEFNQDTFYHTETTSSGDGAVILSMYNTNPFSDDFNDGVVASKWIGLDISAQPAGSEDETSNPGKLTVYAGGGNNYLRDGVTSDNFRFTYQTTSSPTNFDVRVKVESLGNVTGRDFAGLMIRDSTANNARYFAVGFYRNQARVVALYRTSTGGTSARTNGTISTFPFWVRIVKSGNTYTAYESSNGSTWTQITQQTITINTFNFGLATSAGNTTNNRTTAVYDDFSVPTYDIYNYYTTGTVTSIEILPAGNLYSWDTLSWSETLNGGDITIDVLGYNGSSWDTLKTGLTNPSGESLSDINPSTYTRLKLVANLMRGGPTATPYLNSWQVTYTTFYITTPNDSRHPVPERELYCVDCHTPHRDPADYPKLLFEWDPNMGSTRGSARKYYKDEALTSSEASSPRYVASSTIGNNFCWGCHGTWKNTYINSTYYDLSGGDHKTGYEQSAHWTGLPTSSWVPSATYDTTCGITDASSTAINCLNCHLQHGSNGSNRLTAYRGTPKKEEELCYACHPTQQTEFQKTSHHAVDSNWGGMPSAAKVECVSCHNPHLVRDPDVTPDYKVTDPRNTKNIWVKNAANNYLTGFCLTCHTANPPQATINSTTIVPYTIVFPNTTLYPGFPGWNKSAYLTSAHWTTASLPLARKECTNCHQQHGTSYPRLLRGAEDTTTSTTGQCLYDPYGNACHVSGNTYGAPDIKTSLQRTYQHPVLSYSGRHSDTETASSFGTSNRHAECVDCHNPHEAQKGNHTPGTSSVSNALKGTWGVEPPNTPAWQVPDPNSYTIVKPAQYEYQICFKCHSSFAFGTNPPSGLTDQAKEFNPNNASYHGVMAVPPDTYSGASYDSPWTYNSRMYCSDCHGSDQTGDVQGPHGSNRQHIIKGRWDNTMTYDNGYSGSLCDRCHNIGTATGFTGGNTNYHVSRHNRRACIHCHSRIPHGMNNNHLWIFGTDPAPYKDSSFGGKATPWPHKTPGNWQENDCHTGDIGSCG